jgi:anaerobic ribonucleoside-triphosphate reductase activating protein
VVSVEAITARLSQLAPGAAGLTVSGGEPLEQPEALTAMLRYWRSVSGRSVLLFTGREWAEAEDWFSQNAGLVDGVISGRFRSDLPQTLALRGSDNQELRILSELGEEFRAYDRVLAPADRRLDVMFDEDGDAWLAGIPARGELGRLRRLLAAQGHRSQTSDMRGDIAA